MFNLLMGTCGSATLGLNDSPIYLQKQPNGLCVIMTLIHKATTEMSELSGVIKTVCTWQQASSF